MLDINTGALGSSPTYFVPTIDGLYFVANDGTNGAEVFKTDGTASGTQMLAQINPSVGSSAAYYLTLAGNTIFLIATNGSSGNELWKIDLPTTTVQEVDAEPGVRLYPNPTHSNTFKLQFDTQQTEAATITITDLSGKCIYKEHLAELPFLKSITLPEAASGFYLVHVATNHSSITKHLIVK